MSSSYTREATITGALAKAPGPLAGLCNCKRTVGLGRHPVYAGYWHNDSSGYHRVLVAEVGLEPTRTVKYARF